MVLAPGENFTGHLSLPTTLPLGFEKKVLVAWEPCNPRMPEAANWSRNGDLGPYRGPGPIWAHGNTEPGHGLTKLAIVLQGIHSTGLPSDPHSELNLPRSRVTSHRHHAYFCTGSELPASEIDDGAVARALQQELGQEGEPPPSSSLEETGLFFCQMCQKDLSAMNLVRREQHLNR